MARLFVSFLLAVGTLLLGYPGNIHAQQSVGVGVGDTVLDISGKASPDSLVSVFNGSGLISTFNADSTGNFGRSIPAQTPGITRLSVSSIDAMNRPTDTAILEVNLQEHFHTSVFFFLPTTLDIGSSTITDDRPLKLTGQTVPNGNVTIHVDNRPSGTVMAGIDGTWEFTGSTKDLSAGIHGVFASVSDGVGNQSFPSRTQSFTVIRAEPPALPVAPAFPIIPSIRQSPAVPLIASPTNKQVLKQDRVVISGSATARTQVEVWEGQRALGAVWTDSSGAWALPHIFSEGAHTIRARSCLNALCSGFSNTVEFTYLADKPATQQLKAYLDKDTFTSLRADKNGKIRLHLRITEGAPAFHITVDWGDGDKATVSQVTRSIQFSHAYQKEGAYSGRLLIRNALGSQELFFAVNIQAGNVSTLRSPKSLGLVGFLLIGYVLYRLFIRRQTKPGK